MNRRFIKFGIILIIATITIVSAAYLLNMRSNYNNRNEESNIEPEEEPDEENKTYFVVPLNNQGSLSMISGFSDKNTPYKDSISMNQENIKSVIFNLSWVDDKALLGVLGRDTLTLEITTPDDEVITESAQSARKTKEGNVVIAVTTGTIPSVTSIEADSESEALQQLEQEYYDDKWTNKDFNIKVSVNVGEIIRKFFIFGDKGNNFDLEIIYNYYTFRIEESEQDDNDKFTNDLDNFIGTWEGNMEVTIGDRPGTITKLTFIEDTVNMSITHKYGTCNMDSPYKIEGDKLVLETKFDNGEPPGGGQPPDGGQPSGSISFVYSFNEEYDVLYLDGSEFKKVL